MNNDQLKLISATTRKLAENEIPKYLSSEYYNSVPRQLFKTLCANGLGTPTIAEEYGGSAMNTEATALVYEELARRDLGTAIFMAVHSMVAGLIQKFADSELKSKLLVQLSSGEKLAAFALTEPQAGSDAASLRTRATREAEFFILNGDKCYITSAGFADYYLVFAKTDPELGKRGISAFVVTADSPGLEIGPPENKMGGELSPIASLSFKNVKVPADQMVGQLNQGYNVALGGLAGGRINIAACAVGLAEAAIEKARSYIMERKQFGQAIADFQAIQFMLADMQIKLSAARLLTYQAARDMDGDQQANIKLSSSIAKCFATDAAMQITTDAVQLLGGAGYIKDYGVEALMRGAKMLQIVEGTNQIQRSVIARELLRT